MSKMVRCESCQFWDPEAPGSPAGQGYCAMFPPSVHPLNGQMVTTMPMTTGATRCASGIDSAVMDESVDLLEEDD